MGFSQSDSSNCRRHPNPKQVPGVCSYCLRERLTKLNPQFSSFNDNNSKTTLLLSASAAVQRRDWPEVAYVAAAVKLNNGLKKSKSVSCAPLACRSGREKIMEAKTIVSNDKNDDGGYDYDYDYDFDDDDDVKEEENCEGGSKKKKKGGFLKKLIHRTSKKTKVALMYSKTMKESSSQPLTIPYTTTTITTNFVSNA